MAEPTPEILHAAIRKVQELRASVAHVFGQLSEGVKGAEKTHQVENEFLSQLKENLLAVNRNFSEVEKLSMGLSSPGVLSIGNSGLLTQDPFLDQSPLYPQLIQSYKWMNKLHEHATLAQSLISQNQLKRSIMTPFPAATKKTRKIPATGHAVAAPMVEGFIQNLSSHHPNMNITMSRPMGSSLVLVISLGQTLKAIVVLRGLLIEWVNIKAVSEPTNKENGQVDIWTRSKYQVFQKVTDHCTAAMLHFSHPLKPELALKSFLQWFSGYSSLFTASCAKCGTHLLDHLPPTWRDFRKVEAYHEVCRPQNM